MRAARMFSSARVYQAPLCGPVRPVLLQPGKYKGKKRWLRLFAFFILSEIFFFFHFECHFLFFYISNNQMAQIFVNSGKDKRND